MATKKTTTKKTTTKKEVDQKINNENIECLKSIDGRPLKLKIPQKDGSIKEYPLTTFISVGVLEKIGEYIQLLSGDTMDTFGVNAMLNIPTLVALGKEILREVCPTAPFEELSKPDITYIRWLLTDILEVKLGTLFKRPKNL